MSSTLNKVHFSPIYPENIPSENDRFKESMRLTLERSSRSTKPILNLKKDTFNMIMAGRGNGKSNIMATVGNGQNTSYQLVSYVGMIATDRENNTYEYKEELRDGKIYITEPTNKDGDPIPWRAFRKEEGWEDGRVYLNRELIAEIEKIDAVASEYDRKTNIYYYLESLPENLRKRILEYNKKLVFVVVERDQEGKELSRYEKSFEEGKYLELENRLKVAGDFNSYANISERIMLEADTGSFLSIKEGIENSGFDKEVFAVVGPRPETIASRVASRDGISNSVANEQSKISEESTNKAMEIARKTNGSLILNLGSKDQWGSVNRTHNAYFQRRNKLRKDAYDAAKDDVRTLETHKAYLEILLLQEPINRQLCLTIQHELEESILKVNGHLYRLEDQLFKLKEKLAYDQYMKIALYSFDDTEETNYSRKYLLEKLRYVYGDKIADKMESKLDLIENGDKSEKTKEVKISNEASSKVSPELSLEEKIENRFNRLYSRYVKAYVEALDKKGGKTGDCIHIENAFKSFGIDIKLIFEKVRNDRNFSSLNPIQLEAYFNRSRAHFVNKFFPYGFRHQLKFGLSNRKTTDFKKYNQIKFEKGSLPEKNRDEDFESIKVEGARKMCLFVNKINSMCLLRTDNSSENSENTLSYSKENFLKHLKEVLSHQRLREVLFKNIGKLKERLLLNDKITFDYNRLDLFEDYEIDDIFKVLFKLSNEYIDRELKKAETRNELNREIRISSPFFA